MLSKILNVILVLLVVAFIGNYIYRMPKFGHGEIAPEFQHQLINGDDFRLSELQGHYVLLDFWGSWCGPCRRENPELVALYNKFHDAQFKDAKSFEIVSIAVETSEARWKKAIQQDGLIWPYHIAEMQRFKSPIVSAYGVKEIPTKYFINPSGEIISTNASVNTIEEYLTEKSK